jgi:N-acetyl-alpha-D-glucosaminyl L-malate synthase BshA
VKPLRVGIACFPTVGGSGVVASELATHLGRRGHLVHVFSSKVPFRLALGEPNVEVHVVDPAKRPPLENDAYSHALAGAMAEVAVTSGLDVLHVHYALPHAPSALAARQIVQAGGRRAPRLVTTLHGTDVTNVGADPALRLVTRHAVLASNAVTTPSAWLREAALQALDLPRGTRIDVVPNFVDLEAFHPDPERPDLRALFPQERWEGAERPGVLLHASNFRALKRVGDAVSALAEVVRTRPAVLVLVGDGPERAGVERLAASLGLAGRVAFLGERPDLGPLFSQADLFLLPSDQESFGLAALEALASGVPVVASRVGGLPEVVVDGRTGLLVPPHDPRALAAAVLELLDDEPRRTDMGRAAREDAVTRFRPEPMVDRYEAIYREVAERWD